MLSLYQTGHKQRAPLCVGPTISNFGSRPRIKDARYLSRGSIGSGRWVEGSTNTQTAICPPIPNCLWVIAN